MLMIMENMNLTSYVLMFIMCIVLLLITMVTQLHKKELKEAFIQQLYFSNKLLHFDNSMIPKCPPITLASRTSQVQSKSKKKMKKKPPSIKKQLVRETEVYRTIDDDDQDDDDEEQEREREREACEMIYEDTYRYGELEDSNKEQLLQGIRERECRNPLTSCKLEFEYQKVRKLIPRDDQRWFCNDKEDTIKYKYKCPNTDICNSSCDGVTFNGKCYRAISMEFFLSNLRNKSWRIRDPQSRRFINDDQYETLLLLENPKSFKFQQYRAGFYIVQNNDDSRRWGIDDEELKHIKYPRNHVYAQMYTLPGINNKGLIKVIDQRDTELGWLSIQIRIPGGGGFGSGFIGSSQRLLTLKLTQNPTMEWEIIRA